MITLWRESVSIVFILVFYSFPQRRSRQNGLSSWWRCGHWTEWQMCRAAAKRNLWRHNFFLSCIVVFLHWPIMPAVLSLTRWISGVTRENTVRDISRSAYFQKGQIAEIDSESWRTSVTRIVKFNGSVEKLYFQSVTRDTHLRNSLP